MRHLEELLKSSRLPEQSRVQRLAARPIKTSVPPLMTKMGLKRQFQARTFFGRPMNVVLPEPVSTTIWRYGVFEKDVCFYLMVLLRPGDVFIDIGGHFGFFSLLAGELVGAEGRVISFEPMPETRAMLEGNISDYGGRAQHEIIAAAAGSQPGRTQFKDFGILGSAFATSQEQRSGGLEQVGEVDVEIATIDSALNEKELGGMRLVKIDAENAEYDVVQGALQSIQEFRPAIVLEAGDGADPASNTSNVIELLISEGYQPYEFRDWQILPHQIRQAYGYQNLLLLPAELASEMLAKVAQRTEL